MISTIYFQHSLSLCILSSYFTFSLPAICPSGLGWYRFTNDSAHSNRELGQNNVLKSVSEPGQLQVVSSKQRMVDSGWITEFEIKPSSWEPWFHLGYEFLEDSEFTLLLCVCVTVAYKSLIFHIRNFVVGVVPHQILTTEAFCCVWNQPLRQEFTWWMNIPFRWKVPPSSFRGTIYSLSSTHWLLSSYTELENRV